MTARRAWMLYRITSLDQIKSLIRARVHVVQLEKSVGLKPTYGRVPYTGISSGDALDDHVEPPARTLLDAALCLDLISGYDGIDDRSVGSPLPGSTSFASALQSSLDSLKEFRVGVLTEGFNHDFISPIVNHSVLAAASRFAELGATVEQRISGAQILLGLNTGRSGLSMTEIDSAWLPWTDDRFQRAFPSTKDVLINGLYLVRNIPGLYGKSVNIGRQIRDKYETLSQRLDVLVMPTTPIVAPKNAKGGSPVDSLTPSMGLTINTATFNVAGRPTISIPIGLAPASDGGDVTLPVGIQLVGETVERGKDFFQAAHTWEIHHNWEKMHFHGNLY
ncbi:Amidase [Penicillium diatomitis]|uniref:Amidase n=1 Tax=Penicillium diatomitis TaxID=2819901 RepID=A0A9W9XMR4_9EURO|nr:Amidase [Penicillium diatomitis]KAJ5495350.1 Amidase [Penicillium diatomitis]